MRTCFLLVGFLLTGCAARPAPAGREAMTVAPDPASRIAELGGSIRYNDARSIVAVDLHETTVTDADLAVLRELPDLVELDLRKTTIGDAGLVHVATLRKLRSLNVFRTKMTDRGLGQLTTLLE